MMEANAISKFSVNRAVGRGGDQRQNADSVDGREAQVDWVADQH
jgi:hypothetical protein